MDWLSWLVIVVVFTALFAYLGRGNSGHLGAGSRR